MFQQAILRYLERNDFITFSPKVALIDMDGTLYDSMPGHARAWHLMLREAGIDMAPEEFFRHEGRTGANTIDIFFRRCLGRPATDDEKARWYRRKTEIFASMPAVSPMPGAADMLNFLISTGIGRVLVTGSGQSTLLNRLDSDFPGAFPPHRRVTSRDVAHGKPSPEPYLKAMAIASAMPNECIVIENAPLGVEAGNRSGAFTIGVNTGPLDPFELSQAGADYVFSSMTEFAETLPLLIYQLATVTRALN